MIKAGFIQFQPLIGDIQKNILSIEPFLEDTKEADLIVLPELASTGYNFDNKEQAVQCAEKIESSIFVRYLLDKSKQNNQFLVAGFNELLNDKLYNSTVIVGPKGIIGKYQKMHLFMNEKFIFEPGATGLPVFDTELGKIGIQICFDYLFSEAWRVLGLKGAQIVCHPSNLLTQNAQKCIPGNALSNRFFIITSNRIGTENDLTFNGNSFVTDPNGDILVKATETEEVAIFCSINPLEANNKMMNTINHVFQDRRPDQYKGI